MEFILTHWPLILLIFGISSVSLFVAYLITRIDKDSDDVYSEDARPRLLAVGEN